MRDSTSKRGQILEIINSEGSCSIQELARRLNVTTMTIRRYLKSLSAHEDIRLVRGMLIKTALLNQNPASNYSLISAFTINSDSKARIAERALHYISPLDNILIDAGSTCEYFVRAIPDTYQLKVFCFSLNVLNHLVLKKNTQITIAGGVYHESSMLFESREGIELLKKTRTNTAFISSSGVSLDLGITCSDDFERELKKYAILSAQKSILLADSSKFEKVGSIHFANIEDFDIIITDSGIPQGIAEKIRELGVMLDIV